MLHAIITRIFGVIPTAFGVITVVGLLIHAVPGDPTDTILGPMATLAERDALRTSLGLNASVGEQLLGYYSKILHGDLGKSLIYQKPVSDMIFTRIVPTFELAILGLTVALLISLPLGIIAAIRAGKPLDYMAMAFALTGVAIPNFWLGPMLVLVFSLEWQLLPVSERGGISSYVLPALTLGIALAAMLSRMTRTSMLENLREDYVRTAKAKGVHPRTVILKHVLRNACLPLITILGLQFGVLLTGAIITERIFDWPGIGSLILEGINNRDYPVVQGCVLVFSLTYLCVNLLTDLAYVVVDPRIKAHD